MIQNDRYESGIGFKLVWLITITAIYVNRLLNRMSLLWLILVFGMACVVSGVLKTEKKIQRKANQK